MNLFCDEQVRFSRLYYCFIGWKSPRIFCDEPNHVAWLHINVRTYYLHSIETNLRKNKNCKEILRWEMADQQIA